jgi:hypothetical protein
MPGRQRYRGQAFLVTGQVALTSVLLIGAGLLARSFQALQNAPLGFNPSHVLTADINLSHAKYSTQAACQAVFDRLLTKVRQLPGVIAAGLNSDLPFFDSNAVGFGIAGQPDPNTSEVPGLDWQWIRLTISELRRCPYCKAARSRTKMARIKRKWLLSAKALPSVSFLVRTLLANSFTTVPMSMSVLLNAICLKLSV